MPAATADGILVVRASSSTAVTFRVGRERRSVCVRGGVEPHLLINTDGEAAIAAVETDVAGVIEAAADAAGGSGLGHGRRGYARFETDTTDAFVDAVRGAL